jgi:[acyl-carrier-protein] S-malonyltransferase
MEKTILTFPGQGSQAINMGKDFYENFTVAKDVVDEVSDVTGINLPKIMFAENSEELSQTQNTQPALMAVSMAILEALKSETGLPVNKLCSIVAGHSLGEYSALCAAGAISLADTAKALKYRGLFMSQACPAGVGGMMAILGSTIEVIDELVEKAKGGDILSIANDNSNGQIVISGSLVAIERAIELSPKLGIKKAIKLPVSGAFHSQLMQPAQEKMIDILKEVTIQTPLIPIVQNIFAAVEQDPKSIRQNLAMQITGNVRWRESILLAESMGCVNFVEIGSGKVLSGLAKRTLTENVQTINIEKISDLQIFTALQNA